MNKMKIKETEKRSRRMMKSGGHRGMESKEEEEEVSTHTW